MGTEEDEEKMKRKVMQVKMVEPTDRSSDNNKKRTPFSRISVPNGSMMPLAIKTDQFGTLFRFNIVGTRVIYPPTVERVYYPWRVFR